MDNTTPITGRLRPDCPTDHATLCFPERKPVSGKVGQCLVADTIAKEVDEEDVAGFSRRNETVLESALKK